MYQYGVSRHFSIHVMSHTKVSTTGFHQPALDTRMGDRHCSKANVKQHRKQNQHRAVLISISKGLVLGNMSWRGLCVPGVEHLNCLSRERVSPQLPLAQPDTPFYLSKLLQLGPFFLLSCCLINPLIHLPLLIAPKVSPQKEQWRRE